MRFRRWWSWPLCRHSRSASRRPTSKAAAMTCTTSLCRSCAARGVSTRRWATSSAAAIDHLIRRSTSAATAPSSTSTAWRLSAAGSYNTIPSSRNAATDSCMPSTRYPVRATRIAPCNNINKQNLKNIINILFFWIVY